MKDTSAEYRKALSAFVGDLASFIEQIESAISTYKVEPSEQYAMAHHKWSNTALRLLTLDLQTAKAALSDVETTQTMFKVREVADNELHLSKNLDTFSFDFAGKDHAHLLSLGVDRVVQSAYTLRKKLSADTLNISKD